MVCSFRLNLGEELHIEVLTGADEAMPLEECGNMLIMTLGHFQKTGDDSIITAYVRLVCQLVEHRID